MLFGTLIERQAIQQHMRYNARSQSGNSVASIPADILGCSPQFRHIECNRRGWNDDITNGAKRRNSAILNFVENAYFSLGHTRRRFFDGIAYSLPLNKDD